MIRINLIIETVITFNAIEQKEEIIEYKKPERELTDDEKSIITSSRSNANEIIYYQGDEPKNE